MTEPENRELTIEVVDTIGGDIVICFPHNVMHVYFDPPQARELAASLIRVCERIEENSRIPQHESPRESV